MIAKNKVSVVTLGASLLAFLMFVLYVFSVNQEVFYTAHERSEFLYGAPFFHTLMMKPFGLMQYVGAWLTQLFHIPALGAGVLGGIWLLSFLVGAKAFRLQGNTVALMLLPVACLLTSVVDLGYWIYISTIRGYWFSQSVAYLLMLLLLWAARSTPRIWHLVWYLVGFGLYPLLGWYALLFVLCLALAERLSWLELVALFILLASAGIWHRVLYSHLNLQQVELAGLPQFVTPSDCTEYLTLPFWLLGAVSVIIVLARRFLTHAAVPVVCAVAGMGFTCTLMFTDQNYFDEMRMVRSASDDDWAKVLDIADHASNPTISMTLLKDVALMNQGGLLDHAFQTGNNGIPIYNPDSIHASSLEIASPLLYFNYGLNNEAIRLCYENGIQSGFSPFYLKVLSRCALAAGDEKLLERYTTLLHHLPLYADWQPAPISAQVEELRCSYPDEITGVENSDSYLVNSLSLWYDTESKLASEQALFFSMLRCDSHRFWPSLRKYVQLHQGEAFPRHAQEAYIMFLDKAPEEKRMMMPVEQEIYDSYKKFWSVFEELVMTTRDKEKIEQEMNSRWGDTYWYYNLFGRKIL